MPMITLLDVAKANGSDGVVGLVDETTKAHPEVRDIAARTIAGLNYRTLVRVALGNTGGSFRSANQGVTPIKHTYENRLVETFILDVRVEADKAVADRYEDGARSYIAMEAEGGLEGEMQGLSSQFYYGTGTGGNSKGFPGLINAHDAGNMVIDAGGTTAATGSSVWFLRTGPRDVQWVWGANGALAFGPVREETILDPNDSTKKLTGYVTNLLGYPGLQVGSLQSVVRIKKLTEDAGKGLTDLLINKALEKFPAGKGPNLCLVSRRSARQLQSSRTATTPTGAPAPWPNSLVGVDGQTIPIKVTEAISDTEGLTL